MIGCRKEHIDVEENSVHVSGRMGLVMLDRIRIYPQLADLFKCASVILSIYRIREQKFGSSLRRIDFYGHHCCGTNQNAIFTFFHNDRRSLRKSKPAAEGCWDHNCASLAHFAHFRGHTPLP
jgi:hypothetical protein